MSPLGGGGVGVSSRGGGCRCLLLGGCRCLLSGGVGVPSRGV